MGYAEQCPGPTDLGSAARTRIVDLSEIADMNEPFSLEQRPERIVGAKAVALPQLIRKVRHTVHRDGTELHPVVELKAAVGDVAEAVCLLQYRVEYRREVAG
jgi:hypothetical protein